MGWTLQTNIKGPTGATGTPGTNGTNGTNGQGVPTGGTAGQVLTKIDSTNYNTQWTTPSGGGGAASNEWSATDQGFLTWTFDPVVASNAAAGTSGLLNFVKVKLATAQTVGNICLHIHTAGSTLTTNRNFAMLFNQDGTTRLGLTADQTTAWNSAGLKKMAITPVALSAGIYTIAWYSNGSTNPGFIKNSSGTTVVNANLASTVLETRFGTGQTGLTTTPPTTITTATQITSAYWAALAA